MSKSKFEQSEQDSVNEGLEEIIDERADRNTFLKEERKRKGEDETIEREGNMNRYDATLDRYKNVWNETKKLERRYKNALTDPEVATAMRVLDEERHNIHLQALALAEELGRSESEVMADILNTTGNLAELGLPELTLYTRDREQSVWEGVAEGAKTDTFIVFDVLDRTIGEPYDPRPAIPRLYDSTIRDRMKLLAETFQLSIEYIDDDFSHSCEHTFVCLKVPDGRLEEIAAQIRNNREKFGIGEEYYSKEEKTSAVEAYKEGVLGYLGSTDREYYPRLIKYLEAGGRREEVALARIAMKEIARRKDERGRM